MTVFNTIISAIGNNSSIYPLLVRDCGIEVPVKVYKTYKQNSGQDEIAFLATRERIIDEYATSAVWLGGIPLIGYLYNKFISKRGFAPEVSINLLKAENKLIELDKQIEKMKPEAINDEIRAKRAKLYLQSLTGNIEKFEKISGCEKFVEALKKVKLNPKTYQNLQAGKFFAEMALPIALMGFIIPKAVYAMTAATRKRIEKLQAENINKTQTSFQGMDTFLKKSKQVPFGSNIAANLCNFSTLEKMAITDGGYAVGRVATARKKRGAVDIAFKMGGMLYLNFVAPKQIEYILSKISKQMFNLDVNLDPIILGDKEFIKQINNNTLALPISGNIEDLLEFIDNKANKDTLFVKYAKKLKQIEILDNGIRDPRFFVEEQKLGALRDNMENFKNSVLEIRSKTSEKLKKSALTTEELQNIESIINKSVKKFAQKAKAAKTFNIISNVALSSYLLACVLPDAQYYFREKVLGTKLEPDLI